MKWSENRIASAIARSLFEFEHIVLVPNCTWPGSECDLLIVTRDLRIIDVEIKIDRADFKADKAKDKWWSYHWSRTPVKLEHPRKVWKHYFAMPAEVWKEGLEEHLPSTNCGVVLLYADERTPSGIRAEIIRRAIPNKKADRISSQDVVSIARLANIRMWEALDKLRRRKHLK